MPRVIAVLVCALLTVTGLAAPPPAAGHTALTTAVTTRLRSAIDLLSVARETRAGYDREKFRHWVDADGDCRDTRDEVLAAESEVPVRGCDVRRGRWVSYYDGIATRDASRFDVDHLVPLAEAWDSGARRWNAATRQRFANDLRDARTLVAVTASSNRSKSDRDPAEWIPALGRCTYVRQWVAVKLRWRLTVDRPEKRALRGLALGCRNSTVRVTRAVIRTGGDGGSGTGTGGGQDPRFSTCTEAKSRGYGPYVQGRDSEYGWYVDADGDGIVCE